MSRNPGGQHRRPSCQGHEHMPETANREEQISQIKETFAKYDDNGDGALSTDEFKLLLKRLMPVKVSEQAYVDLFRRADKNNNGKVDTSEFIDFCFCEERIPLISLHAAPTLHPPGGEIRRISGCGLEQVPRHNPKEAPRIRVHKGMNVVALPVALYESVKKLYDVYRGEESNISIDDFIASQKIAAKFRGMPFSSKKQTRTFLEINTSQSGGISPEEFRNWQGVLWASSETDEKDYELELNALRDHLTRVRASAQAAQRVKNASRSYDASSA